MYRGLSTSITSLKVDIKAFYVLTASRLTCEKINFRLIFSRRRRIIHSFFKIEISFHLCIYFLNHFFFFHIHLLHRQCISFFNAFHSGKKNVFIKFYFLVYTFFCHQKTIKYAIAYMSRTQIEFITEC